LKLQPAPDGLLHVPDMGTHQESARDGD
jgi:hypothetical protein